MLIERTYIIGENSLVSRPTDMTSLLYESLFTETSCTNRHIGIHSVSSNLRFVFSGRKCEIDQRPQVRNTHTEKEVKGMFFLSNCFKNPSIYKGTEIFCVDKPAALVKYVRVPGAIIN